jgi:hypothetical protein
MSAGIDPWLSIERQAQEPILEDFCSSFVDTLWFQGTPETSFQRRYRFLNWIILRQVGLMYSKWDWFRKPLKRLWDVLEWNALGSSYLNRMVRQRATETVLGGSDRRIHQNFPIQLSLAGIRTLDALRYSVKNYEFDYLLRLTSTCIPVPSEIADLVSKLPLERVYGGKTMRFSGTKFVSGAAILFSRDVVEGIVDNAGGYFYNVYEDVGLGRLIQSRNLAEVLEIERLDLTSVEDLPVLNTPRWPGVSVVRCKVEAPVTTESEPVVRLMQELRKRL